MTTVQAVLETAFAEVGYTEKPVNKTKFGKWNNTDGQPWCGAFVNWVFSHARVKCPNCTFTPAGAAKFKALRTWHEKGEPLPGDVIFFDFPHDGVDRISHVGIVVRALANGKILTIEGNTTLKGAKGDERNGGGVAVKERKMSEIVGWGRPNYKPAVHPIVAKIVAQHEHPAAQNIVKKVAKKVAK